MVNYNDDHNPSAKSQAQLDAEGARAFKQNEEALAETFKVQETKDGKAKILGIEIPHEIAPTVTVILSTLLPAISHKASGFVYNQTKNLTGSKFFAEAKNKNLLEIAEKSPKIALAAELTTMWAVFAADPVSKFVSANKDYTAARMDLSKQLKSICEATGADYQHNEVIKGAYRDLHDSWMDDMKLIVPSLISIVPFAQYGIKMHGEIKANRAKEIEFSQTLSDAVKAKPNLTPEEHRRNIAVEKARAMQELEVSERAEFEKTYKGDKNSRKFKDDFNKHMERIENHLGATEPDEKSDKKGGFLGGGGGLQDMVNFGTYAGVAATLGQTLSASMRKKQDARRDNPSSFQMIQTLSEQAQGGMNESTVQAQVVEIFQRLEEEMGRNRFAGGLLEKLEDSTQPIAEAIANGRLDPLSLVKLAGEHEIIAHSGGKRSFHNKDDVQAAVSKLLGNKVDMTADVSAEEFIATFANPLLAKDTIKKNLSSMHGAEKDFFIAVMPTEILLQAGMKKKDIQEHRRAGHERLYNQVAAGVVHIASLDEEKLKNFGVSAESIAAIRSLNDQIMSGDMEQLKIAVDARDLAVAAVAQVGLAEQVNNAVDGPSYWANRTHETPEKWQQAAQRKEVAVDEELTEDMENRRGVRASSSHAAQVKRPPRGEAAELGV